MSRLSLAILTFVLVCGLSAPRVATAELAVGGNVASLSLSLLLDQIYTDPQFGNQSTRGFIVKEINGAVLAGMNTGKSFQPLSTLKLLPYLYAMIEIDKSSSATLQNTSVTWIEATQDDPATSSDERKFASCYSAGATNTKQNSATYSVALPTMMWFSHNRTLDAFLAKFGPDNITNRAHQLGLANTQMFFGCPQGNDPQPWAKNRSTLLDLAKLFEGVDKGTFLTKNSTRQAFYANMININYAGASYDSPMLAASVPSSGSFSVKFMYDLPQLVQREASKIGLPDAVVDQFLQQVVVRGKGGSGGPNANETGYSDFLHVTLPFKQPPSLAKVAIKAKKGGPNDQVVVKEIVPKSFSVGWFIYNLKTPAGCPDPGAAGADKATCDAIWHPERLSHFTSEIFTPAVRKALATW